MKHYVLYLMPVHIMPIDYFKNQKQFENHVLYLHFNNSNICFGGLDSRELVSIQISCFIAIISRIDQPTLRITQR